MVPTSFSGYGSLALSRIEICDKIGSEVGLTCFYYPQKPPEANDTTENEEVSSETKVT